MNYSKKLNKLNKKIDSAIKSHDRILKKLNVKNAQLRKFVFKRKNVVFTKLCILQDEKTKLIDQYNESKKRLFKYSHLLSVYIAHDQDSLKYNYAYTRQAQDNVKKLLLAKKIVQLENILYA